MSDGMGMTPAPGVLNASPGLDLTDRMRIRPKLSERSLGMTVVTRFMSRKRYFLSEDARESFQAEFLSQICIIEEG